MRKRKRSKLVEDEIAPVVNKPSSTGTKPKKSWYQRAERTFIKVHKRTPKDVIKETESITFDGYEPIRGRAIEAWAVNTAADMRRSDYDRAIAKFIIGDYFFGRYPSLDGTAKSEERGYNLSADAFYTVKVLRSLDGIDPLISEPRVTGVRIFRDYDLSPKTFSYSASGNYG